MSKNYIKIIFRSLHTVLVIFGISVIVILASDTKGHPPGIIFAPIAIGLWVVGHVLLWISYKLAKKGEVSTESRDHGGGKWPLTILILSFVFGGIFVFGFFVMIFNMLFENNWQKGLPILLVVWVPPSICFVGILLRQAWSRFLTSGVFISAALFLLYQMIESTVHSNRQSTLAWVTGTIVLVVLFYFGLHMLRSSRIKAFYSK